jgi:hypothetical protein
MTTEGMILSVLIGIAAYFHFISVDTLAICYFLILIYVRLSDGKE